MHRMGQAGRAGLEQVTGLKAETTAGRAGIKICRYGIVPFRTVTSRHPSELYTDPQLSFLGSGEIWYRAIL